MPRNQEQITLERGEIAELTNADATSIAFQVAVGDVKMLISGTTEPATGDFRWSASEGEGMSDMTLADYGTGGRVWALGMAANSVVVVTHA